MLVDEYSEFIKRRRMMPSDTIIIEFSDKGGSGMSYNGMMTSLAMDELWKSYSGSR